MSEFQVNVVRVDSVEKHSNADTLTIVKIGGFDCISSYLEDGSLRYKPGDLVVYIPEASLVPEWMLKKMGFWDEEKGKGTLSGTKGNRVKAIKLRGVVSQGILYPVMGRVLDKDKEDWANIEGNPIYVKFQDNYIFSSKLFKLGDDVAEFLGIEKYEPVIPVSMRGKVGNLFGYTKSYDIENIQKYMNVFEDGEEVVATEKLHGTLCQIGFIPDLPDDKKVDIFSHPNGYISYVTSKGLAKQGLIQKNTEDNQENIYVKNYKTVFEDTTAFGESLADVIVKDFLHAGNTRLYIFGEIFGKGVQDLTYDTEPTFRVFDVYINVIDDDKTSGRFLDETEIEEFCDKYKLQRVPVLYRGPFTFSKMEELRGGKTVEGNEKHIREGIVIRPVKERYHRGLPDNRAQLKFISPDYLLRKNGTEFN